MMTRNKPPVENAYRDGARAGKRSTAQITFNRQEPSEKKRPEIFSHGVEAVSRRCPCLGLAASQAFQSSNIVTHHPPLIQTLIYSKTRRDPFRTHRTQYPV